jgi:hypothetical protein
VKVEQIFVHTLLPLFGGAGVQDLLDTCWVPAHCTEHCTDDWVVTAPRPRMLGCVEHLPLATREIASPVCLPTSNTCSCAAARPILHGALAGMPTHQEGAAAMVAHHHQEAGAHHPLHHPEAQHHHHPIGETVLVCARPTVGVWVLYALPRTCTH